MDSCELCNAVLDSKNLNNFIWNTPLFENQTFVVLPSIGPLCEGHIIIVSKSHALNLLTMSKSEIKDFISIVDYTYSLFGSDVLFAEHGSFLEQQGGGCIDHTHIHVLPGYSKYFNILDEVLPISDKIKNIKSLSNNIVVDFPYILCFSSTENLRLYKAYNVPSQMVRKTICIKQRHGQADWKTDKRFDLINKTILIWNKI